MLSTLSFPGPAYLSVCGTSSEMSGGPAGISKGQQGNKLSTVPAFLFSRSIDNTES